MKFSIKEIFCLFSFMVLKMWRADQKDALHELLSTSLLFRGTNNLQSKSVPTEEGLAALATDRSKVVTKGRSTADLANFLRLSPLFPFQPLPLWPVSILLHWVWDRPKPDKGLSLAVTKSFAPLLCCNVGLGSQHWQYQSTLFIS